MYAKKDFDKYLLNYLSHFYANQAAPMQTNFEVLLKSFLNANILVYVFQVVIKVIPLIGNCCNMNKRKMSCVIGRAYNFTMLYFEFLYIEIPICVISLQGTFSI